MTKNTIQIKIEISKRFFCFYALLNVLGYNPEIFPVNPLRQKVRNFLESALTKSKYELTNVENLIKRPEINREFWFPLRNWIICHDQPPTFKELSPYWKNFLDVQMGKEFGQELKCFWKTIQLASIWKIINKDYIKSKKQCYYNASIAVKNSLDYLRFENKKFDFKKFIVIPNFLDEYNRAVGPKINNNAYAILGPSKGTDTFPIQRIEHEFLHSLINPITKKLFNDQISWPQLSYIRESLIRAIVLRLNKSNKEYYQKKLERLKKSGYKDIDKTIEFLEKYENQQDDFKTFLTKNKIISTFKKMKSKTIKLKFIVDSRKENWFIDHKYNDAEKSIGKDRFAYIVNNNTPNVYNENREIFYKNIKKYIKLNKKTINSKIHDNSRKIISRWEKFENKFFSETEKITGIKWKHKTYKTYFLYSCFWGGDYDIDKPNIYINPLLKFGNPLYVIFHELTHLLYWEYIYSKYSDEFIGKNYNFLWKLSEIMVNYPLMKLGIGFKFLLVVPKYLETFGKNIIKKFPKMTFVDIVNSEIKKGAE